MTLLLIGINGELVRKWKSSSPGDWAVVMDRDKGQRNFRLVQSLDGDADTLIYREVAKS